MKYGLLVLCLLVSGCVWADTLANELSVIMANNSLQINAPAAAPAPPSPVTGSEISIVGSLLIRGYQLVISTQDEPSCNFTPSCSHFAQQAITKYGFCTGSLMATDRLTRCNGKRGGLYSIDPATGLNIDPIENWAPTPPLPSSAPTARDAGTRPLSPTPSP